MGARLCCRSVRGRARKRRPPHNRDTGTQPGQRQPFLTRRGVSWSRDLQQSGRVFSRLLSRLAQRSSEIEFPYPKYDSCACVFVCEFPNSAIECCQIHIDRDNGYAPSVGLVFTRSTSSAGQRKRHHVDQRIQPIHSAGLSFASAHHGTFLSCQTSRN